MGKITDVTREFDLVNDIVSRRKRNVLYGRHCGELSNKRGYSSTMILYGQHVLQIKTHLRHLRCFGQVGLGPNPGEDMDVYKCMGDTLNGRQAASREVSAKANDRRHLALCHDEFRGPRSGLCRSGGIDNNKTIS
ncbi:hypothetical protein TNCV_2432341 [Trichonephila clavipes]|nr:hypothetical protein TNCV_2432341 [Trichonephila clavipes]